MSMNVYSVGSLFFVEIIASLYKVEIWFCYEEKICFEGKKMLLENNFAFPYFVYVCIVQTFVKKSISAVKGIMKRKFWNRILKTQGMLWTLNFPNKKSYNEYYKQTHLYYRHYAQLSATYA